MAASSSRGSAHKARVLKGSKANDVAARLDSSYDPYVKLPTDCGLSERAVESRWSLLARPKSKAELFDAYTAAHFTAYEGNIENFVGTVKIPVGVAGPLRVNGLFAKGDYLVPLATTEAALVASYTRGAIVVTECGGCAAVLLNEGVSRAPVFVFRDLQQTVLFVSWVLEQLPAIKRVAEATTRHGKFEDLRVNVEGNHVYLVLEFTTGDASGQNMVTIAADAVREYIVAHSPVRPSFDAVEGNLSGDKKASHLSFLGVRGKKVAAEVFIPEQVVKKKLFTTSAAMTEYWRLSAIGGVMSGSIGFHGHYANGLAALYIACGQDAACVSESAVGITRFEQRAEGLYAAVTLPNIMVGTVGGGTALPSQSACLALLGLPRIGGAQALAEVAASLVLAGEISIIAALSAGHFTKAHRKLARKKQPPK